MKPFRLGTVICWLALLAACGGGGGGGGGAAVGGGGPGSGPAPLSIGQFIDAPVAGLGYACTSPSGSPAANTGTTNALGQFSFATGQGCTFKVGNVTVGSVAVIPGDNIVTPQDVVGVIRSATQSPAAVAIAQFLQSLDDGSTPGTITIPAATTVALGAVPATSIVSDSTGVMSQADLSTLVRAAGKTSLVTGATASLALQQEIASGRVKVASGSITAASPVTLNSIVLAASDPIVVSGLSSRVTATGHYSDGSTRDLTSSVTWTSSSTAVATVEAGAVKGVAPGAVMIAAQSGGVKGMLAYQVGAPVLQALSLAPGSPSVIAGLTTSLVLTGTYSDNSRSTSLEGVTWSSSSDAIASVRAGTVTGVSAGTASITASVGAIKASVSVSVREPTITSIVISAVSNSVQVGSTLALNALASLSNNTQRNVSALVNWVVTLLTGGAGTDATSVATIQTDAVATTAVLKGTGLGTVSVSASYQGVTSNALSLASTVGGTVEGLASGSTLRLSFGSEVLAVTANGSFVFRTMQATGGAYSVGIKEAPAGHGCAITDGAGVIGGSGIQPVRVRCVPIAGTDVFLSAAQGLVDLEPLYASFCPKEVPDNRAMQHVVPVDVNRDGRMDLIVYLWCSPVVGGNDFTGPTPSRLRVLMQDVQGNFLDRTAEVFGSDLVQPGGVGEYYITGDFNKDGYTDIIWSLNREDGRRMSGPSTNPLVRSVAVMSRGDGRYTLTEFGNPAWGFGVVPFDNAAGGKDFVMTSATEGQKAWTFSATTGFTQLPGYDWVGSAGSLFFDRPAPGLGSQAAVVATLDDVRMGLDLHTLSSGAWTRSPGGFYYPTSRIQKLCCNNNEPSGAIFIRLDGKDFIDPSFAFTCQFRRTPTSRPEALTVFGANEIVGGYTGQVVVYNQTPLLELFKLMSFGITTGNTLARTPLVIRNEVDRNVMANRMSCGDVNGDGFDDIVLHATKPGQTPLIYLNDGTGAFDRVSAKAMPTSPSAERSSNYVLADLDGDGTLDLIYFPIIAFSGGENRILVHKGLRKFTAGDIMK